MSKPMIFTPLDAFLELEDQTRVVNQRIDWSQAEQMMEDYKNGDHLLKVVIGGHEKTLEGLMLKADHLLNVLKVDSNGNAHVDRVFLGLSERDDNLGHSLVVIAVDDTLNGPIFKNSPADHIYDYCDPCPPSCPNAPQ